MWNLCNDTEYLTMMETVSGSIILTVIIVGASFGIHLASKGTEVPLQLIFATIHFSK